MLGLQSNLLHVWIHLIFVEIGKLLQQLLLYSKFWIPMRNSTILIFDWITTQHNFSDFVALPITDVYKCCPFEFDENHINFDEYWATNKYMHFASMQHCCSLWKLYHWFLFLWMQIRMAISKSIYKISSWTHMLFSSFILWRIFAAVTK